MNENSRRLDVVGISILDQAQSGAKHKGPNKPDAIPRNPIEEAVAKIGAEVLGVAEVGIHDNFFELGGNSLLATQIHSRVCETFQVALPLDHLFESPTVAQVAAEIEIALRQQQKLTRPAIYPVKRGAVVPLSFSQERIWFIHQLDPDSSAYNIVVPISLKGQLDLAALERSLSEIARRHESLRTTFAVVEGQPVQIVAPDLDFHLSVVNLASLAQPERSDQALHLIREEAQRPFDLSRGPLWRVKLFRLEDTDYVLLINMQHTIADAWSLGVFAYELVQHYKAITTGKSLGLAALSTQYADFAIWQREWMQGETLQTLLDYWRKQLDGVTVLQLSLDFPRPALQTYRGTYQSIQLSRELFDALKAFSSQENATLFMTLLSAFMVLLYRYTGQEDIAVGTPIANRQWLPFEDLIGTFVNTLVMRSNLSGTPTFRELLGRIRQVAVDAYVHQDLPFAKLVAELKPERSLDRSPFFQVMFNVINVPMPALEIPGITTSFIEVDRRAAQFDLSLTFADIIDLRLVTLEYNTDLFESDTITRFLGQYKTLLESIVVAPDQRISELPILTDAEKHQLVVEWNDTARDYPRDRCAHQLFEEQAERTPDAIAVIGDSLRLCREERLTYRALDRRANQLAQYLKKLGVEPEVCVGISLERSVEMLVAMLGVLKAGGTYLPLDPVFPKDRLSFMIHDAQVPVLITQQRLLTELPAHTARVVCLDADWEQIIQASDDAPDRHVTVDNLAYILYTSGSTGKPKGVQVLHRALTNFLVSMRAEPGLACRDILLAVTTLSFDIAGLELFLPLITGACVVIASREVAADGKRLGEQINHFGVTAMQATPVTWRMLVEAGWKGDPKLKILCGGEALSRELADELLDRCGSLWNMYGPTETTIWSTLQRVERNQPVTVGRPIANTRIYILDANYQPAPIGAAGNLYIGGDGLARGYVNLPELTAERFVRDPFRSEVEARMYKTGDVARYRRDGMIDYLGRSDNQVKLRGYRIELGEIETLLSYHPGIRQAVVLINEDGSGEKILTAYLIPALAVPPASSELRRFLKSQVPDYMVPSAFVMMESFPVTANGKVDRRAFPKPEADRSNVEFVAPRDAIENQLVEIWEKVLGVCPIGVTQDFFDLGGHSLLAIRLFSQIRKVFDKELGLMTIFQAPTIEQMAGLIREDKPSNLSPLIVPIQVGSPQHPPFFCIHGFGGGVVGYGELARLLGTNQTVYGIRAKGEDGRAEPHTRIEEMAECYIEAMKAIQPAGPYYLGGYCFGGIVAFEMACQLSEHGERVGLVAVFEGYAPVKMDRLVRLNPRRVMNIIRNAPFWLKDYVELGYAQMLARLNRKIRSGIKRLARFMNPQIPFTLDEFLDDVRDIPESYRRLMEIQIKAQASYVPRIYSDRIMLFRVQGQSLFRVSPEMGWDKLTKAGVDVRMIAGAHLNILKLPYVQSLATELQLALEAAQAGELHKSESSP